MIEIDLCRFGRSDIATFGALMIKGVPFCLTIELPWRNNESQKGCIFPGTYYAEPESHPKFLKCFRLKDHNGSGLLHGRSGILIHAANLASELQGCIAPGSSFDLVNGSPGVINSRKALEELVLVTNFKKFQLNIWNA